MGRYEAAAAPCEGQADWFADIWTDDGNDESDSPEYFSCYLAPKSHVYPKKAGYVGVAPHTASAAQIPFSAGMLALAKKHRLNNLRWVCLRVDDVYEADEDEPDAADERIGIADTPEEASNPAALVEEAMVESAAECILNQQEPNAMTVEAVGH